VSNIEKTAMSHDTKAMSHETKAMSTAEKADSAKGSQNLKPTGRDALRSGSRLLSVVRGKEERSLHLSPILQQIKDDGPAVIDGEVVPEVAAAGKLAKPVAADAKVASAAIQAPVLQMLLGDRNTRILLGFCALLTLGLGCSLWISYQQQQQLETVEYLLETLVAGQR
jgi:hypothetical protein